MVLLLILSFFINTKGGGSQLYEFGVAVMDKSCDSNYSTVFINCENETTLYPGALIVEHCQFFTSPPDIR